MDTNISTTRDPCESSNVPPNPGNVIHRNVACIHCDYNLRGMPAEGRCPECGNPVSDSTHADLLSLSSPHWVKRLRTASQFLIVGIATTALSWVISSFAWLVFSAGWNRSIAYYGLVGSPIGYLGLLVLGVGIWLLATPDPREVIEHRWNWIRMLCRANIGIAVILSGLVHGTHGQFSLVHKALWAASMLIHASFMAMPFAYIRRLSGRMPDKKLGQRCAVSAVLACSMLIQMIPLTFAELDYRTGTSLSPDLTGSDPTAHLPMGVWEVLTPMCHVTYWSLDAVFLLFGVIVMRQFSRHMRDAARRAKAYAADDASSANGPIARPNAT